MGLAFFRQGHTPSALNFFLRTAELTEDKLITYKCLLYCAICLHIQKERPHAVKGFLLHAISVLPERPEAWFMYIRFFKENRDWQECLSFSINCLKNCDFNLSILEDSDYAGRWSFLIFKIVSSYQCGRFDESRSAIIEIIESHWDRLNEEDISQVKNHIELLNMAPNWMKKLINC